MQMWPWTTFKSIFFEIESYTKSESWINKLSIDEWFDWDTTIWKSGIWGCKKNTEKI